MIGLEIPFKSPLHRALLDKINTRVDASDTKFGSARHTQWKEAEETFTAYVPTKEADEKRKAAKKTGSPQYVTLEIPYTYALLLAAHTYWSAVFLGRSPVFQYSARHGEAQQKVNAIEALIDYQLFVGRMLPHLYVWLMDAGKYGLGVVGVYWDEELITTSGYEERQEMWMGVIPIVGKTKRVKVTQQSKGYVGNRIFNIRPFDFICDPRVSVMNFQQGEFCGRHFELGSNAYTLGKLRKKYFNEEYIEKLKQTGSAKRGSDGATNIELPGMDTSSTEDNLTPFLDAVEICIELVPAEWGLGKSEYPEKWVFTVVNEEVIIGAQPLGLTHNKFPYAVLEYEIDGYSLNSRGLLEIGKPLNDTLSWLFNTHFYNVRKSLNDMLIYDPMRVRAEDIEDPNPGKRIRLKPAAYGADVRGVVHQLTVHDVTRTHMQDAAQIIDILQHLLGISDNIMGQVNPGGRKTATEIRTSSSFSVNRMKTQAEFFSATGFSDLSSMLVQSTQQLYDLERAFKIAGDNLIDAGQGVIMITNDMLQGFFDFVPVDGTLPVDKFALGSLWKEMVMGAGRDAPWLMQEYDFSRIFSHTAKLLGLKNIEQFKIKVIPDAAAAAGAVDGSLIPVGGAMNVGRPGGQAGHGAGQSPSTQGTPGASGVGRLM